MMKNNFMICGLTGWCMEIIFTSLDSIRNNNFKLTGHTSIWMFPIYGMAAVIPPVYLSCKLEIHNDIFPVG